jgi:regulator of protease activity HflC (stomatin/prohibitin superfamily)
MGKLVFGGILLLAAVFIRLAAASVVQIQGVGGVRRPVSGMMRALSLVFAALGVIVILASAIVVIGPGTVGVKHAFGYVSPNSLMPGIRVVEPWSSVERFSSREEQFPEVDQPEEIDALSSEQMGMKIDVALRWQIDPQQAPRIFTEIGTERQIHSAVQNAIRNGVRDGMVQFSINDIAKRNLIASVMEAEVDSALVTQPRAGTGPFRIATVTAFFLRDLQPPPQVVQAINNKIAQEQQIQTERHRVEVARLQSEQQRLLNVTLTPEALMKQYLEVLHDMRQSNNLVVLVPTEGGTPVLNLGDLRRNMQQ